MHSVVFKTLRLVPKLSASVSKCLSNVNQLARPIQFSQHLTISTSICLKTVEQDPKPLKPNRPKKKSKKTPGTITTTPIFTVKAYATADYYDLDQVEEAIKKSQAYEVLVTLARDIPDNCVVARAKYPQVNEIEPRYLFFFEEGAVVLWNCSNEEQTNIIDMLNKICDKHYTAEIVKDESETLTYSRSMFIGQNEDGTQMHLLGANDQSLSGDSTSLNVTRLFKNHIYFRQFPSLEKFDAERENLLEKYALSDAIALSCMLGIWEKRLENFTDNIEYISEDLKRGVKLELKTEDVLQKLGELFTMRHMINLNSNYLETPDFYWDRENLENLYTQIYYHLSVSKRTRLFNNRVNDCIDLMQILREHLNDKKHTRLEWIIIGLIAIEASAALGIFDFVKKIFV